MFKLALFTIVLAFTNQASATGYILGYSHENFGPAKTGDLMFGLVDEKGRGDLAITLRNSRLKFDPLGTATVSKLDEKQYFFLFKFNAVIPDTNWVLGFNYDAGQSLEERLYYKGPTGSVSYKYEKFGFRFDAATFQFLQKFDNDYRVVKSSKPTAGEEKIRQDAFTLGARWQMEEWLGFSVSATRYHYSSDVKAYAQNLESFHGTSNLLSGLQNPLSAFNEKAFRFTTDVVLEGWLVNYELRRSLRAVKNVVNLYHSILLNYSLPDQWKVFGGSGLSTTEKQVHVGAKSVNSYMLGFTKQF